MTTTTQLMTAEELMRLEGPNRHELIKGELLTMPPPGDEHGAVTMNLTLPLALHVKENNLGVLRAAETGFKLETNPDTVLAPDIAFIARERVGPRVTGYRDGAPDLAVEVMSQWDSRIKTARKAALWLELGARSVWIVNPRQRTVEVCSVDGAKRLFHETDELVDDTVPGFRVKVSEIFA